MTGGGVGAVLQIEHLSKRLGATAVLVDVDLDVEPGVTALVGANGSGKSTLLRICAGLLQPTSGRVLVTGDDPSDPGVRDAVLSRCGLATEEPSIDDLLTVREQLELHGRFRGMGLGVAEERVAALAQDLNFERFLDHLGAQLSRGTRQKVAVARALLHDPTVVLLDEPTNSLDVSAADAVERIIARRRNDQAVLMATHDLDSALRVADRLVGLSHGRIVLDMVPRSFGGTHEEVRRRFIETFAERSGLGLHANVPEAGT